jgi:hypothetical protein
MKGRTAFVPDSFSKARADKTTGEPSIRSRAATTDERMNSRFPFDDLEGKILSDGAETYDHGSYVNSITA